MWLTGRHRAGPRFPILLLTAAVTVGCTDVLPGPSNPGPTPPSFYLNGLLDLIQANSIKRLTIDWPTLRRQVERDAAGARTIPDLYPAIRTALTLLGDGHSSYQPADGSTRIYVPNRTCSSADVALPNLPNTIGYVRVTAFSGSGEATFIAFRQRLNTRSFGVPTCGLSTANSSFRLSDGATLILTVSVMADRTKTRYGDTIAPDELMTDPEQTVQRAVAWLEDR